MSELAKTARAAMKEKARRMSTGDPHQKVDASSWTPSESMNAGVKTGLRPISQRQFKSGGAVHGDTNSGRADRRPRKSGGSVNALVNANVRAANEERPGLKHIGGFKSGGRTSKDVGGSIVPPNRFNFSPAVSGEAARGVGLAAGGHVDAKADRALIKSTVKPAALRGHPSDCKCAKCSGGRVGRAMGGVSAGNPKDASDRIPRAAGGPAGPGTYNLGQHDDSGSWSNKGIPSTAHRYDEGGARIPPARYDIYNRQSGNVVGSAKSLGRARSSADRRDNDYGGYAHSVVPVYESQGGRATRADGGSNWIAGATKNKGALHRELHVPEGQKIPAKKLAAAAHSSNPTERKRADLAKTLKGLNRADGGRTALKHGGKAGKGKMNVNIVIAPQGGGPAGAQNGPTAQPPAMPPRPPMPMPMPPQGGMPPGMPMPMPVGVPMPMAGGMPPQLPPGAPPMPRKRGGGVTNVSTGAGGGLARLEKIRDYGLEQRK